MIVAKNIHCKILITGFMGVMVCMMLIQSATASETVWLVNAGDQFTFTLNAKVYDSEGQQTQESINGSFILTIHESKGALVNFSIDYDDTINEHEHGLDDITYGLEDISIFCYVNKYGLVFANEPEGDRFEGIEDTIGAHYIDNSNYTFSGSSNKYGYEYTLISRDPLDSFSYLSESVKYDAQHVLIRYARNDVYDTSSVDMEIVREGVISGYSTIILGSIGAIGISGLALVNKKTIKFN